MNWIQPLFEPRGTRFTSSNARPPFSVFHKSPLIGSNVMPKLLRTPNANIWRRFAATSAPSAPPISRAACSAD